MSSSHGRLLIHRKNRAKRRREPGEIARLVHGPHDNAWLYSGTLYASGQARINRKREQRAEFWRAFCEAQR